MRALLGWVVCSAIGCYQPAPPLAPDAGGLGDAGPTRDAQRKVDAASIDAGPSPMLDRSLGAAFGYNHACEIPDGGRMRCWGGNGYKQLGAEGARTTRESSLEVVVGLAFVDKVAAGKWFTCGAGAFGQEYYFKCWGYLVPWGENSRDPLDVSLPDNREVTWFGAGEQHVCALLDDGSVWCAGSNRLGQLQQAAEVIEAKELQLVHPAGSVRLLSVGGNQSCAVIGSGADVISCWGGLHYPADQSIYEMPDIAVNQVTKIVSGAQHTCVIEGSKVICWGGNTDYQLGHTGSGLSPPAEVFFSLDQPLDLSLSRSSGCVRTEDSVVCRGGDQTNVRSTELSGLTQFVASGLWEDQHCGTFGAALRCFDLDGNLD
jgi:alpha-tubulin suppressor-like RCC1 family protein